jgi:hypothetical protein
MLFAETVENAGSVFVDTAPLIYFIEAHPIYGPLMKQLVGALSKGRIAASALRRPSSVLRHLSSAFLNHYPQR